MTLDDDETDIIHLMSEQKRHSMMINELRYWVYHGMPHCPANGHCQREIGDMCHAIDDTYNVT